MSKLASHYPEELEIYQAYHEARNETEAFEEFDANNVEPDLIEHYLGKGVLNRYMTWIYLTIK